MSDKQDCVFYNFSTLDKKICVLGHDWECETDATVCGDYERRETFVT